MVKKPSLPYLPIAGKITDGFVPVLSALVISEMLTALSRIWTWVTDFISYGDNSYIQHTYKDRWNNFYD